MNLGCEAIKFFPAEANGGVAMLKEHRRRAQDRQVDVHRRHQRQKTSTITWPMTRSLRSAAPGCASRTRSRPAPWDEITAMCKEAVDTMLGLELGHIGINSADEARSRQDGRNPRRAAEYGGQAGQLLDLRRQEGVRDHEEAGPAAPMAISRSRPTTSIARSTTSACAASSSIWIPRSSRTARPPRSIWPTKSPALRSTWCRNDGID